MAFACVKFNQYVYGREKVRVQNRHKPLEVIFKKPLENSTDVCALDDATSSEVQSRCDLHA